MNNKLKPFETRCLTRCLKSSCERSLHTYVRQCRKHNANLSQVENKSHLVALSSVSRNFRSCVFPRLFKTLTIEPVDECLIWDLVTYPFFDEELISRVPNVLKAVKELRFMAPFKDTNFAGSEYPKRCPHYCVGEPSIWSRSTSEANSPLSQGDVSVYARKQQDTMDIDELGDMEDGDLGLVRLAKKILILLSKLPDNQLSSFR